MDPYQTWKAHVCMYTKEQFWKVALKGQDDQGTTHQI